MFTTDPARATAQTVILWEVLRTMTCTYLQAYAIARVLAIGTAARTAGVTVIFVGVEV